MFCPNCGEKLENPNQKFCASCGSELQIPLAPDVSEAPQIPVVKTPVPPPVQPVPVYDVKPIKSGGIGSNSKKSLIFALIGMGFFVAGLYIGYYTMLMQSMFMYLPYMPIRPGMWIITIVLHLIGLIFSIVSKTNSSKARKFESKNGLQKAGSIISVFGIVLNAIFLVVVPLLMGISIMNRVYYDPFI